MLARRLQGVITEGVMMLTVHVWCTVGRCGVARVLDMVVVSFVPLKLLNASWRRTLGVLARNLRSPRLISNRWKLDGATTRVGRSTFLTISRHLASATVIFRLSCGLLILLALLPLLANFLELCNTKGLAHVTQQTPRSHQFG